MSVYYSVTPEQWNKLNENSKPRPTNEKEKESAEELYRKLESDFLDIGGMFIDEDEWEKENGR